MRLNRHVGHLEFERDLLHLDAVFHIIVGSGLETVKTVWLNRVIVDVSCDHSSDACGFRERWLQNAQCTCTFFFDSFRYMT